MGLWKFWRNQMKNVLCGFMEIQLYKTKFKACNTVEFKSTCAPAINTHGKLFERVYYLYYILLNWKILLAFSTWTKNNWLNKKTSAQQDIKCGNWEQDLEYMELNYKEILNMDKILCAPTISGLNFVVFGRCNIPGTNERDATCYWYH